MKKKLFLLLLTIVCSACIAGSLAACSESHNLTYVAAQEATCTEDGNTKYWYCEDCGKYFSDSGATTEISQADTVISATGHKFTHVEAEEKTCSIDGNIEYWYCETCGKYYSDANGTTEINQTDTVTVATGHTYNTYKICTTCGMHEPTSGLSYGYDYHCYYVKGIGTAVYSLWIYIADAYDDGTHGTYPVKYINSNAFENCTSIEEVTMPDSVTSIYSNVFNGCTALESVTGSGLTKIRESAFEGCSSLKSVTVGDSLTTIGENAFYGCSSLESITLPDSLTTIGENAFEGCSSLESIIIPDAVTSIGRGAFTGCHSLTSAAIGNGVTSIEQSMFTGCTALTSVTLPDSVASIGSSVFYNCTALTSVTLPDSVTSIDSSVFDGCTALTSVIV